MVDAPYLGIQICFVNSLSAALSLFVLFGGIK